MDNNIAQLKDNGLKVTGPRLKILDLFEARADEHMSAEDVYRLLLDENVEIGVAPSTECSPSLSRPVFCCATILKPARRCTN